MINNETNNIEYKRQLDDGEKLEIAVVAFLNTKGGDIFIGIGDDGAIVGVSDPDEVQTKIANRITDNIKPDTGGLVSIFTEKRDNKTVVVVKVSSGIYTPYYLAKNGRTPKGAYYRLGATNHQMTENMIDRMMNARHLPSLTGLIANNQDLTFRQLKNFYESVKKPLNDNFAKSLKFYAKDNTYNELAEMFADENAVSIRVARWNGTDKSSLIQNEEFGNRCLLSAMDAVISRLDVANVTQARKAIPTRIEKRYIDEDVLKEAIINAFAHNDYTHSDTPIFEIYDDRIEITTYGDLLAWMNKDDFFSGTSKPRNPEIMKIFQDLDYVEHLGSGVPNIVKTYGENAFYFSNIITRLTLKFDKSMEKSKEKSKEKILAAVQDNPKITTSEMSEIIGLSVAGIEKNIRQLREEGVLLREGGDKGGQWIINKK
jgi:predicted HTH transcriptional regulator